VRLKFIFKFFKILTNFLNFQNEEKTIVYVLSKKDDQVSDFGEIPQPPAPVTHKPEVFFIKYKTKQEAAEAVANIQGENLLLNKNLLK
jgi:hypothetical protein